MKEEAWEPPQDAPWARGKTQRTANLADALAASLDSCPGQVARHLWSSSQSVGGILGKLQAWAYLLPPGAR